MSKPNRIYWDACTWIEMINQNPSRQKTDGSIKDQLAICQSILNRVKQGKLEMVASAFILAEVCKDPHAKNKQQSRFPKFLDSSFVLIVPVDKEIGLKALALQNTGIGNIKPGDAVHIVTAQYAEVEEFHTFDDDLLKLDGNILDDNGKPIKICKPGEGVPSDGLFGIEN